MHSPFWYDKQSHMTQIIRVWYQIQLLHLPLNLQSFCFGSNLNDPESEKVVNNTG